MTSDDVDEIDEGEILRQAPAANLDARARTDNARQLVASLAHELIAWEKSEGKRTNKRRRSSLDKLQAAIAAFLADLLSAQKQSVSQGWTYRVLSRASFSGEAVSYRVFKSVLAAWKATELIEYRPGYTRTIEWDAGEFTRAGGFAARFRATPKLLDASAASGLTPENVTEHFVFTPPEHPLVLRLGSEHDKREIKFKRTAQTECLEQGVREINEFVSKHEIKGANHRAFRRIFNCTNPRAFKWNKGGRLYSVGRDTYQQQERDERLKIVMDGEPVCEIDIRASYLTILHARHKVPFIVSAEHDPYGFPGLPRGVVKAWCTVRFGSKGKLSRWPTGTVKKYAEVSGGADLKKYRVKEVGEVVCAKYALLRRWSELPETWADLMWLESQAVLAAMEQLMRFKESPSLPVHDSLIVAQSHSEWAAAYLTAAYSHFCGVRPYLEVHHAPVSSVT